MVGTPADVAGMEALVVAGGPLDVFSFPSGDVMHSVAFSVVLTTCYPIAAAVVWPLTILFASSRVILGLHYPSDVVAGAALGATVALLSFNLL